MAAGLGLLCLRPDGLGKILAAATTSAVCIGVIVLAARPESPGFAGAFASHWISWGILAVGIAISAFIIHAGMRAKNLWIVILALAQMTVMVWFETTAGAHVTAMANLHVDKLSVIMALINGLVGGGICIHAIGYMREYHQTVHPEVKDRRPMFFSLLFVFMGAMFGLIFSNNLTWLFLFWEITTLCSFLLIGYSGTDEARHNARRALVMNLAGGLAFALAIVWCHHRVGSIELQALIGSKQSLALIPAALLCFAGITKSAQLPFSGWLLGAMVAPTPVSALLHSSTMVKAGVYLVLRMSPAITGTKVGMMVAVVGGITFAIGSLAAITTSEAKRVLAWSTIANLGLIVLCGGIGTHEAMWAGVLLIIFHAVSKCLLFLCVGAVDHRLHSRNIEDMSGLILRMPRVAVMMLIGMAGMFLAPFGMLISKWAVMKAVVDAAPLLSVFIVFGSSATLFFWVKWMGKLVEVVRPAEPEKHEFERGGGLALYGLAGATFLTCLLFPLISHFFVEPSVMEIYGVSASLGHGNIIIMMMMMALVMLFPVSFIRHGRGVKVVDAYLGGANADHSSSFIGSASAVEEVTMHNYYLGGLTSETWLSRWGVIAGTVFLAFMLGAAFL
jgi:ech hydrogenase subunit A